MVVLGGGALSCERGTPAVYLVMNGSGYVILEHLLLSDQPNAESREIGNLLPNNRRQRRTCYALCHLLYPVSAAQTSIFRMDSNSTSYDAESITNADKLPRMQATGITIGP